MKKVRGLFAILLAVVVIGGSVGTVKTEAAELSYGGVEKISGTNCFCECDLNVNWLEESKVHEVCAGLPYHKMYSSGWCTVYKNGKKYIGSGACWKCRNCNTVIVTEGDRYYWGADPIGKYAVYSLKPGESVNYLNVIYNANSYGSTRSSSLNGYKFYFN